MQQNLGQYGLNLYAALHSAEQFDIKQPSQDTPKSIGHSYTLPRQSKNTQFIQAWLRMLSEMVAKRLRENRLVSKTIHLWLSGPEIGNFGAQKTFQQAINDGYDIFLRCLKIMAKMTKKGPKIRALGVTCSNLKKANYPPLLAEQKKREGLIKAIDKINDALGENTIYPAVIKLTQNMP